MTNIHIDSIARKAAETFVSPTHPNGLQTNAYAVAKRMHPDNISKVNALNVAAGRSCFPNDEFAANVFEYAYLNCYSESQIDVFSALLASSGGDIGQLLKTTAESEANLAEIQSDEKFNIRISPLHAEFQRQYRTKQALQDKLKNAMDIDVLPLADPKSWIDAALWIVHSFKANISVAEANELMAEYISQPLSAHTVDHIKRLKSYLHHLLSECDMKAIASDLATTVGGTPEELENAAITGRINQVFPWQQLLNRMEATSRDAIHMTDFRRATELSSVETFALDFSVHNEQFKARPQEDMALQAHENTLHLARMDAMELDDADKEFTGEHSKALVAHILMYAGVDLDLFERSTKAGQGIDRPRGNVPLRMHALAPYYSHFLKDLWKCFVPEARKLTFYTKLSELATKNGSKPIHVDKAVPDLTNDLRQDLENLVVEIKNLGATGKAMSTDVVVDKFLAKLVQYEQELITPFDDIALTTITSSADFVLTPYVCAEATRPLGVAAHPSSRGQGFAEGILGVNMDAFGAITESCTMDQISDLYNRVSDFSSVNGDSVNVQFSVKRAIEAALNDIARGTVRRPEAGPETITASKVIEGSHFAKVGGDFYAFIADETRSPLLLASGGASVDVEMKMLGNIHGSFAYGKVTPRGGVSLSGDFDKTVTSLLFRATELLINSYVPRNVKVHSKTQAKVSFTETNDKYAKRISLIDSSFSDYDLIDKPLLQAMASSPMINNVMQEVINKDLLLFVNSIVPKVRHDVMSYLNITAARHMTVLRRTYSTETLRMFRAMLTRPLNAGERVVMMRPEFASSAEAVSRDITNVMKGLSSSLRAVYTMLLFQELAKLPEHAGDKDGESIPLMETK